jgi:site-specific recombinase XerD
MLPKINYEKPKTPLETVMVKALEAMRNQGYPESTRHSYGLIWRHLLKFAANSHRQAMIAELCEDFLSAYEKAGSLRGPATQNRIDSARRALRPLMHFAVHGAWKPYRPTKTRPVLPPPFANDLHAYLQYLEKDRGLSPQTLRSRHDALERFLVFVRDRRATNWPEVTTSSITAFFTMRAKYLKPGSLASLSEAICGFLRFLLVKGRLDQDWSTYVPRFRPFADQSIPSGWPLDKVNALLGSIDRNTVQGKRDFAILLIAARLGMRAGDIRALRLESLRWDDARIEFIQGKTGRKSVLPLTDEIGTALIDYLLHGRPSSPYREVFLRYRAPYRPMTYAMGHIMRKYCRKAKVELPSGHMGMHSLRHTLARQLLLNDTPLETIAEVLGHYSLNTTRVYAKVNLKQLRTAALDPEEVCHA